MQGAGQRWLIGLAVAAAVTTATPVGAETYIGTSGETVRYIPASPTTTPRRTVSVPAARRASRRPPPNDARSYAREIADAAAQYAVPERLIWAVIRVESGFDHRAVSRKGARGLMQLMPATAAILGVRNVFDPRENIHAGTRHLRAMMERFPYDLHLAVAAYNAGERAVTAFRGIPPYPETRDYVTRVLRLYATPIDCCQSVGSGIQRIVENDGTVTYTNIPVQRVSVVAVAGAR
jgi:soluble lytic murein transglycosylase-like protein